MKEEEKKKSLFGRVFGAKKGKGGCCNIELEEDKDQEERATDTKVEDSVKSEDKPGSK